MAEPRKKSCRGRLDPGSVSKWVPWITLSCEDRQGMLRAMQLAHDAAVRKELQVLRILAQSCQQDPGSAESRPLDPSPREDGGDAADADAEDRGVLDPEPFV